MSSMPWFSLRLGRFRFSSRRGVSARFGRVRVGGRLPRIGGQSSSTSIRRDTGRGDLPTSFDLERELALARDVLDPREVAAIEEMSEQEARITAGREMLEWSDRDPSGFMGFLGSLPRAEQAEALAAQREAVNVSIQEAKVAQRREDQLADEADALTATEQRLFAAHAAAIDSGASDDVVVGLEIELEKVRKRYDEVIDAWDAMLGIEPRAW